MVVESQTFEEQKQFYVYLDAGTCSQSHKHNPSSTHTSKTTLKNDAYIIFNAITILIFSSDVFFSCKGKHHVTFAPCRCKKVFPTMFFPLNGILIASDTCINTFYKTLLEVKNAALNSSNSSAPPAHRRLHLVLHTYNPGEKERGKKPVDNNCYRFLSCPSKITGLSCPCFPMLALLSTWRLRVQTEKQ